LTQKNPAVWPDFLRSWFFTFLIIRVLDFSHLSCFDVKLAARPEEFEARKAAKKKSQSKLGRRSGRIRAEEGGQEKAAKQTWPPVRWMSRIGYG
jgi:hypothetical protein